MEGALSGEQGWVLSGSPVGFWQRDQLPAVDSRGSPSSMVSPNPECLGSNAVLGKRLGAGSGEMQCLIPSLFSNYRLIQRKHFSLNRSRKKLDRYLIGKHQAERQSILIDHYNENGKNVTNKPKT